MNPFDGMPVAMSGGVCTEGARFKVLTGRRPGRR
jgi:hypothetical protein